MRARATAVIVAILAGALGWALHDRPKPPRRQEEAAFAARAQPRRTGTILSLATPPSAPCAATVASAEPLEQVQALVDGAELDVLLAPDRRSFVVAVPARSRLQITASLPDGRTSDARAECVEAEPIALTLRFPAARVSSGEVAGRCTSLETGSPLKGAHVQAFMGRSLAPRATAAFMALTGEGGRFRARPAAGAYVLVCAKDGDESAPMSVEVTPGARVDVELRVSARTTVTGVVVDAEGVPVEGAGVSARFDSAQAPKEARTDESGRFVLAGLPLGPITIAAQHEGAFAEAETIARVGLPYAEVTLTLEKGGVVVSGRLVDASGEPVTSGRVSARAGGELGRRASWIRAVPVDAGGRFQIAGLLSADTVLTAEAPGFAAERVEVAREALAAPVEIRMSRGCSAEIRVLPELPRRAVVVDVRFGQRAQRTLTGETGDLLALSDVAGNGEIRVHTLGSTALAASAELDPCAQQGPLEVSLDVGEGTAAILASVVDAEGSPVPGVDVYVEPGHMAATTDDAGQARFEGLEAGDHWVMASDVDSARVKLEAGEAVRVELTVPRARGSITGSVTAHSLPVEGAAIRATCGDTGRPGDLEHADIVARSDAAGAFTFEAKDGGVCLVRAEHPDEGVSEPKILKVGGLPAEIELLARGAIEGVVRDDSGAPVKAYALTSQPLGRAARVDARTIYVASPDGRFRLEGLSAGTISLSVSSDAGKGHAEVALSAGETRSGVEIRILDKQPIVGRVVSGSVPVPGARVTVERVVAAAHRNQALATSQTGADGRFRLEAPGGDSLSLAVSARGFYPWGSPPFDLDGSGTKDLGDVAISPRAGPEEKEGGIGIGFSEDPEGVRVDRFAEDSPARDAGVEIGDVITAIDGTPAGRLPLVTWLVALRGRAGTPVVLQIERGTAPRFSVTVIRRAIGLPEVPMEAP